MRTIMLAITVFFLSGCTSALDTAIEHHSLVKTQINMGMELNDFLTIFEPYQSQLSNYRKKPSERFTKDGLIHDVYYIRSAIIYDGAETDDEFTPYIFIDGELAEIGWLALGGTNRTSQDVAREKAEIKKAEASATKINNNVQQKTNINNSPFGGVPLLFP